MSGGELSIAENLQPIELVVDDPPVDASTSSATCSHHSCDSASCASRNQCPRATANKVGAPKIQAWRVGRCAATKIAEDTESRLVVDQPA